MAPGALREVAERPLDREIKNFMSVTSKKNVAVIIPLYGDWSDREGSLLNGEVLYFVLDRLHSSVHNLYEIFVTDPRSIQTDVQNPKSIANVLAARNKQGNVKYLPVRKSESYNESIRVGVDYALNETNSEFIVILNPWVLIQHGSIDVIIDRANRGDTAKVICGFDLRSVIDPEGLDTYQNSTPKEEYDISFNFMAMPRFAADMLALDPVFLTHEIMARDIWQRMFKEGYVAITTQRVPVFPFDFPWKQYESKAQHDADRQHFVDKWHFDPGVEREVS